MSMMRKRTIAIIAAALCIIILGFSLAAVLEYVSIIEFVDVDGKTKYYAKKDDGVYKLYAKNSKEPLPLDEKYKSYYITTDGTLVLIDETTGQVKEYIPVDNVEREDPISAGTNRVMMYNRVDAAEMLSLDVFNSEGSYRLEKDESGTFVLESDLMLDKKIFPSVLDRELLSSLYTDAGYALASRKVDPIKRDANGALCTHAETCSCEIDFSEYGLVEGERTRYVYDDYGRPVTDETTGERVTETYYHTPTRFILRSKDAKGNVVTNQVIIGDPLVTGSGYYAQYVKPDGTLRERLYVLDNSTGKNMNAPIEDFITPMMNYPMTMNRYYDVDSFTVSHRQSDNTYKDVIKFSYVDLSLRENTMAATDPYKFELGLAGYTASDNAINACLYNMYSPAMVGVVKHLPTEEDLVEYGFITADGKDAADYKIFYAYDVPDDDGKLISRIFQTIMVSAKHYEEKTTYYTYTKELRMALDKNGNVVFNSAAVGVKPEDSDEVKEQKIQAWMAENTKAYSHIAEVQGYTLDFINWDKHEWVTSSLIEQNIAFLEDVKLTGFDNSGAVNYFAHFDLDNSKSDQSTESNSNLLFVNSYYGTNKDNAKFHRSSFANLEIRETEYGRVHWNVTSTQIEVYSKYGDEKIYDRKIPDGKTYYDYNSIGIQVLCTNTPITNYIGSDAEGNRLYQYVWAYADYIVITDTKDPNYTEANVKATYIRYDTNLFRKYYQSLLTLSIVDSYQIEGTPEEALIVNDANRRATLELSFKDKDGTESDMLLTFYYIPSSARKMYITLSVNGGEENGGFYLYKNKVEKLFTDADKFFADENIIPTDKR